MHPNSGLNGLPKSRSSEIWLATINGYGTANTQNPRFSRILTSKGSDVSYIDDVNLGTVFKIVSPGVYAIGLSLSGGAAVAYIGIVKNVKVADFTDLLKSGGTPNDCVIAQGGGAPTNQTTAVSVTTYLEAGDEISGAHQNADGPGNGINYCYFRITKIS